MAISYEQRVRAQRAHRAHRMRAFYEPAWFGDEELSYDTPMGTATPYPLTLGGYQYQRALPEDQAVEGPDPYGQTTDYQDRIAKAYRARRPYEAPQLGVGNVPNLGVGQLRNYGSGALRYSPTMMRR